MITLVIGHRGVGKTSFVKRVSDHYQKAKKKVAIYDLDKEIELRLGKTTFDLFRQEGEQAFRRYEEAVFTELMAEVQDKLRDIFIAMGAGYCGPWPEGVHKLWLRRDSDSVGRIFLDRPRLSNTVSPIEEYLERYEDRQKKYKSLKSETFFLREGFHFQEGLGHKAENTFLGFRKGSLSGFLTLQPKDVTSKENLIEYYKKRRQWGLKGFEIRDDILDSCQIIQALTVLPKEEVLYARRNNSILFQDEGLETDWALELGKPQGKYSLVSLHERESSILETLKKFRPYQRQHKKLSIFIENFKELELCHKWYLEDPENRSFLPRSQNGRWQWYRLLFHRKMKFSFLTEDKDNILDQPTFFECAEHLQNFEVKHFSAILGNPVKLSWTPANHQKFFSKFQMPVLWIQMDQTELKAETLSFLFSLGLKAAAVTSPLKKEIVAIAKAFQCHLSKSVKFSEAANTMAVQGNQIFLENTDVEGFKKAVGFVKEDYKVAVWGGGGTRKMMQSVLPKASFYSARTANLISGPNLDRIDLLVWAVGRHNMPTTQWPIDSWSPKVVLDLNYSEDSPGREYALKVDALYTSGEVFFREQAKFQREFWEEVLFS